MTIAVTASAGRNRDEAVRWGVSLVVVMLLHALLALFAMSRQIGTEPSGQPPSAVMIDLSPLPVPAPPQPAPPEPVVEPQVQPEPPPLPPEPEIKLPAPEPNPAPKPAVVLPKPPPKPKPHPIEHPPEALLQRPPRAAPAVTARAAPAPAPAANPGVTRASWQAQLAGQLERYKRYPRLAQEQHQEGIAYLRFAIDRQGHVLSAAIDKGSGFALLDEEVLALVQRAQPLPAPPPEVPGIRIELTVPVRFHLDRQSR